MVCNWLGSCCPPILFEGNAGAEFGYNSEADRSKEEDGSDLGDVGAGRRCW